MITAPEASPCPSRLLASLPRTLVLVLLLVGPPVAAQAPQQPQEQPEAQTEADASVADAPTLPPADTDDTATPESEDPFDYEASEQISEDLSVSFPVDI